jgi:hypothetical protein
MKKLFTLVALLACFLGAKAEWNQVYTIDYSQQQSFPFYVMGYVPEFGNGCMTDLGAAYRYATQADLDGDGDAKWKDGETSEGTVMAGTTEYQRVTGAGPYWHQYFIADGIQTKIDGKYKVVAKVKATNAVSINVNMGWGWGQGEQASTSVAIPANGDFEEVVWEYSGISGTRCNLVAQPGTSTETIEWQSLTVYEWVKEGGRVPEWIEDIENGNAETPWTPEQAATLYNDMENNYKICAWSKEKGHNMDAEGKAWNPFPATIIEDPDQPGNHVFVCYGQTADTEGDASAWDNQFWIQSKHAWKSGLTMKIKFRYKASADVSSTDTQIHKQTPSDYLIWHAIGNIHFTEEWQTFDNTMVMGDDMAGGWSIAFNLNSKVKDAVTFYFDDLSWQYLKLDEGYFLAGINQTTTDSYDDLDNAIPFEAVDDYNFVATIGEEGKQDTYVDQLMISTTRGDDSAFKGATLKPQNKITNDAGDWNEYVASANAKLNVPGLGVWKVYLDTEYTSMAFEMLDGTPYEEGEPVEVFTYTEEITVNGKEREDLKDSKGQDGAITVREEADDPAGVDVGGDGHNGETWDNQFFIKANHKLEKGTVTKLVFKYKASVAEAKTTTQCHGEEPGAYMHWAAIGDVVFTDEWQDFEQEFTVPDAADGMWNIAFNMAEIKEACDYSIKDVQWYLYDASLDAGLTYENLISGSTNFYKKEGAGTTPYTGIENVTVKNVKTSNAIYNIAGQRVNKDYKGLVIKDGKKFVK